MRYILNKDLITKDRPLLSFKKGHIFTTDIDGNFYTGVYSFSNKLKGLIKSGELVKLD